MAFQFVDSTKVIEKFMVKNKPFQNMMFAYYGKIVKNEVNLSGAKEDESILCIGGGYFPCTAILFHKFSGANITVIDNDKEAVLVSQKLIKRLGLDKKINVQYAEAGDFIAGNFDVIHIAMQVSPKIDVFNHLRRSMASSARILVRTPKRCLECGYQPFGETMNQESYVIQPVFSNIERTLMYVA